MADTKGPFHTLHHICLVVKDVDKAIQFYESIGIGPWRDYPPLEEFDTLQMPDEPGFKALKFKYAAIGPIQLQMCTPGPGGTPQRKFFEKNGEGVFHVGFVVDDVDMGEEDAKARGLKVWMRGRRKDKSGFTYFDTKDAGAGVTLSIRKSPPAK
jgi:methylmalonyl-CoA/ethylmalonyl-CoA epimerase